MNLFDESDLNSLLNINPLDTFINSELDVNKLLTQETQSTLNAKLRFREFITELLLQIYPNDNLTAYLNALDRFIQSFIFIPIEDIKEFASKDKVLIVQKCEDKYPIIYGEIFKIDYFRELDVSLAAQAELFLSIIPQGKDNTYQIKQSKWGSIVFAFVLIPNCLNDEPANITFPDLDNNQNLN